MAVSGICTFLKGVFPAHLVPVLSAAAIVASCSFAGIPENVRVTADSSARTVSAPDASAIRKKSAFLPITLATATTPADKVKSAMSADHGDAAWICTASGFGQKSRCRARAGKG
ncbi:hypothetical protein [Roseibium sp.]|uniref:hypothetical protein n=1 Tax=Roseibium sp. TaxID=1936156 RepID=UPI003BAD1C84